MRSYQRALFTRAARGFPLVLLALAASGGAFAQTPLAMTVHTVTALGQPPAVEHDFTITNAGSYSVTLIDLGSKLPTPAPLASVAMAVTQGAGIVGTPATAPGTPITFTATANATYTIHVVGVPGSPESGAIEEDVTDSGGNQVFSSIDNLSVGSQQPGGTGFVDDSFTVSTAGTYTVSMVDLQFPAAMQTTSPNNPQLILVDGTTQSLLASLTSFGSTQTTSALTPGDTYYILAEAQEGSGIPGGLFSVSVTPSSGPATYSKVVPVGAVTLLQTSMSGKAQSSFTLGSSQATLQLTNLAFPTVPLTSVGAIVVDATTGQTALPPPGVTGTGAQNFTPASSSDSYQVYAYAVPDSTAGDGSYSLAVQQGTAFPFIEAQAVTSSSTTQAFSFDTGVPSTGSYTLTLTDFKFPVQLTSDALAAIQNGQLVKSINAAGNVSATFSQGPVTLLAFGAEGGQTASPGLMGIDLSPAGGGASIFDVTEGIGAGFSSTTFTAQSAPSLQANVADLKFPAPLASLNFAVTSGTTLIGTIASAGSSGSFPFKAAANTTYTVNVLATPATPTNSQQAAAGTYAMSVDPAPVVTLSASSASVTSGGTVTLTWTAQNATSCTASATPSNSAWSGSESPTGGPATTSAITADTTFSLSCTGGGGTGSATATVNVSAAPSGGKSGGGGALDLETLLALAAIVGLRWRVSRSGLPAK
jgi:hypothetical protein